MLWQTQLKGDSVAWLLEKDEPGVRYLALRDLMELSADDRECGPRARLLTSRDRLLRSWPRWTKQAFGRSPAQATTRNIDRPCGR